MLILEAVVGTVGLLVAGWLCTDKPDKQRDRRPRTKVVDKQGHRVFVEG